MSDQKNPNPTVQLTVLTVSRLFINTGLRMVYPFLPAIARGLGVSLPVVASLVSVRGFAGLVSPLFGPLSERFGRRKILALSMVLFSAGSLIVVFWPELWAFGLTLSAIAVAKVIYDPAMQAYIGDTVPYEKRGRSIAITELSWAGAFILGVPLISFAIQEQSWLAPFVWLAVLGGFAAGALLRLLPKADGRTGAVTNLQETWRVIRHQPVIWAAAFYIFLVMGANELILIVYGDWMETGFGLSITNLGLATAVIGSAEVTGEVTTAIFVDRIGKRPFVITTGIVTAVMYFTIPIVSVTVIPALISLFVLFLFFEMTVVGGIPIMTELIPWARGIVLSVILAIGGLGRAFGALVGPILWSRGNLQLLGLVSTVMMIVATAILAIWIHEAKANS